MSTYDRHPGTGPVQRATAGGAAPATGKHTLTGQLDPNVPLRSTPHAAPAHQVAERDALNCWITVIVRGPDGAEVAHWRARGRWIGPLPVRYHGTRAPLGWTWSDPAARFTRIHTLADGTGGEPVERWATAHGAATVDVIATGLDDAAEPSVDQGRARAGTTPGPGSTSGDPAAPHPRPAHEQLLAAFWREVDAADAAADQAAEDGAGGRGAPGGDPHGRTGPDTAIGGAGPGGPQARVGGDHEGSQTRGAAEGTRFGSVLGVAHGSEGGRFGGEGKPGDDGVRMASAIAGGVIAVPAALKGIVELLLLADAGDITGAGANAFKTLSKELAGMSAATARSLLAREAREVCRRELDAAVAAELARSPQWLALSTEERLRVLRITYYENMRQFFRGFGKAAKDAERSAERALRRVTGGAAAVEAREGLEATKVAAEAVEIEPIAGRLPRNHKYAGGEFPRELLPPRYKAKGLKIKSSGYPDFEPYALELPTGKKTVKIDLTGSRGADEALANKTAGLAERPEGWTWHHIEDEGTMMLVPTDLHRTVGHTASVAKHVDRTGVLYGP